MTEDELNQVEALLIALRKRLQQLGKDVNETERIRIKAWQRRGELLGEPTPEFHGNRHTSSALENHNALAGEERQDRHRARLLAAYPDVVDDGTYAAASQNGDALEQVEYNGNQHTPGVSQNGETPPKFSNLRFSSAFAFQESGLDHRGVRGDFFGEHFGVQCGRILPQLPQRLRLRVPLGTA